jgi:hypothetical protein
MKKHAGALFDMNKLLTFWVGKSYLKNVLLSLMEIQAKNVFLKT